VVVDYSASSYLLSHKTIISWKEMMTTEKPLVSIIIVNYNGKRFLKECLSTVLGSKYPNFEIIFVDNASTDNSSEFVSNLYSKNKSLKIIRNRKNLGFGPANNEGFKQAKGDYIIFLNNDTSVEPEWLAILVEAMENDETIGLASSLILNMDGQTIQTAGILKCDFMMPGYWIEMNKDYFKENFPSVFEVSSAMGAAMIARRKFLKQIGVFDPKYFYYYDDDYLSFRTWLAGKRVVTVSRSRVCHFLSGTSTKNDLFKYRHAFIGSTSLIFDIYWDLIDLMKGLFIFFVHRFFYDSLLQRKIVRFWGSISGAFWVLKNLKYVWRNRLRYWRDATVDEKTLRHRMIKITIPASIYLIPRLRGLYFKSEIDKYRKTLFLEAKEEIEHNLCVPEA
jgi:GT2 family glycosyltransferase